MTRIEPTFDKAANVRAAGDGPDPRADGAKNGAQAGGMTPFSHHIARVIFLAVAMLAGAAAIGSLYVFAAYGFDDFFVLPIGAAFALAAYVFGTAGWNEIHLTPGDRIRDGFVFPPTGNFTIDIGNGVDPGLARLADRDGFIHFRDES